MSIQMYFINETKKQVVSSKKLFGTFEDEKQLLCYINMCQGDTLRTDSEDSEWINDYLYNHKYQEYEMINLYNYELNYNDFNCKEYERFNNDVNK